MAPAAKLDVQDRCAARPGGVPFVGVAVDAVDVGDRGEGGQGRLFGGLACKETRGGGSEDDADGEARVVGEGGEDAGDLDGRYAAASGEEEVFFVVVVVGCDEGELGWLGGLGLCGGGGVYSSGELFC